MPRVSFIVPVYNATATLDEALESMLRQSYLDFEVVLFDDGSTDGSRSLLERWRDTDNRMRVIGGEHVGLVGALNAAADAATGELYARMDADDICHPERLALQVNYLDSHKDISLVGSRVRHLSAGADDQGMRRYVDWLNENLIPEEISRNIFVESPLCHPSVVMRREAFERAGGYWDDQLPEDYGLWLRFYQHGLQMAKVPDVLLEWRDPPDRFTRTDPRAGRDRFDTLKVRHLIDGPLKGRSELLILGTGRHGRRYSRLLAAEGFVVRGFVDAAPGKWGRTVHGVPVLSPAQIPEPSSSTYLLAAVGTEGARAQIRSLLIERGYRETRDFTCIA